MKFKAIFAVLSAAMCLPVLAQQVTVYGVIDQAVRITKPDGSASQTSIVSGSFSLSRLGFRGVEDLGGGIQASVQLESSLDANNGTVGGGGNFFNRDASISVASPLGTVTLGRTDTSGSEGVDTFVGVGHFGIFTFAAPGIELAQDRERTIRYTTPTLGGVTVQMGRSLVSTQGPETDSVSATFVRGNLGLTAGYDRAGSDNYRAFGARYDLGFVSVGGMHGKRDSTDTKFTTFSARVPLQSGFALLGSYRVTETPAQKVTVSAVGISKNLSKRTRLVGVYQDTNRGANAGSFYQGGIVHSF